MIALPDKRDKAAEERAYLDVCHRTPKHRPTVESILWSEHFFDASQRPPLDAWEEIYNTIWQGPNARIKGAEILSALRDHLASLQEGCCCYCRGSLLKGGYSRPIEHVLPRVNFPRFSFYFWNVAVSCERCNRLKKTGGYQAIPAATADYPDYQVFTDFFHPRLHVYKDHVWFWEKANPDYRYVVYTGLSAQGRALVGGVLAQAALEMTRESTDPAIRDNIELIRQAAAGKSGLHRKAIADFEEKLRLAIDIGAA